MTGSIFTYTPWPNRPPVRSSRTSTTELIHLGIALTVMTVDMILFLNYLGIFSRIASGGTAYWVELAALAAAAAFSGFVAHELAHKFVAQRGGFWSEFRMSPLGLLLSLVTATFGFLFAAPGATLVNGEVSQREWGRIGLAGPALNLSFCLGFYAGAIGIWALNGPRAAVYALLLLTFLNGWIATFNLIPFGPLDGRKVYRWSVPLWATVIVAGAILSILGYLATQQGTPLPSF